MTEIITSRADLDNRVVTLWREGVSIRALTRRFRVSRNTIRGILVRHGGARERGHTVTPPKATPRRSALDAFDAKIKEVVGRFDDITGQRLFEILRGEGYKGGITIVREKLRQVRPTPKVEPVVRFETEPGEQGQMDWSPYEIDFERTGKEIVLCFSYVLGYSRYQYGVFTDDRRFPTLVRRHQDAFAFFGGAPKTCLYDGEKTVLLRWEAGQPIFNPKFLAFITHYACRPVACRPRRAQTKGKVERPFDYHEKNFFNGRRFQDKADLAAQYIHWRVETSNSRDHRTTGRPPVELFHEREQTALRPLPLHPYDTAEVHYLLCNREGYVTLETNRYSVPAGHVLDVLPVKATEAEIIVYSPTLDEIARHERRGAGVKEQCTIPAHELKKHERHGVVAVRERFIALGDGAEDFLVGLERTQPRSAGMAARLILAARERYAADDITAALRHAMTYDAYDAPTIERILKAKYRPRSLESVMNEAAIERLRQALPKVEQRSLDTYTNFLGKMGQRRDETNETDPESGRRGEDAPGDAEAEGDGEGPR